MSSKTGGEIPVVAVANYNPSFKGKNVTEASDISGDPAQDDGGWEVYARKSKNRAGSSSAKPWATQDSSTRGWGRPDMVKKPDMRNNGGSGRNPGKTWVQTAESRTQPSWGNAKAQLTDRMPEKNYMAPQPVIPPPLERGWNWQSRAGSTPSRGFEDGQKDKSVSGAYEDDADENYDDDNSDAIDDSDDELLSDDFDSDTSQKSHGTRKKSRWFSKFFESLDSFTVEEINEPARQWHCPACQRGPGAIDWYHGLQPLMTHAKTKGSRRIKLHRELAELLEEELHRRGTSTYPAAELFGQWKGLKDEDKDHDIIWPPMVVILNTRLEKDENDKWIGMGNQELLAYFSSYAAVKARHSYGPQGHRGISVLIFENSAGGYLEAERLHKHFSEQGTDREAWNHRQVLFLAGGKRQLYGFMALKEDLDFFNQHAQGKSKLKFELRSYQEMVVKQIRQMSEDNQQLDYFKNKVDKEQRHSKSLEASFSILSERLRKTMEENRIVKQRTRLQHAQYKEEMDLIEQFYKDQIKEIHKARDLKEEDFEMIQQQERDKVKQLSETPSNTEDYKKRVERMTDFIKFQDKEMEEFVEERDQKIKVHEDKKSAMRRRYLEDELELEKEFDAELSSLMKKYSLVAQKLLPPQTGI